MSDRPCREWQAQERFALFRYAHDADTDRRHAGPQRCCLKRPASGRRPASSRWRVFCQSAGKPRTILTHIPPFGHLSDTARPRSESGMRSNRPLAVRMIKLPNSANFRLMCWCIRMRRGNLLTLGEGLQTGRSTVGPVNKIAYLGPLRAGTGNEASRLYDACRRSHYGLALGWRSPARTCAPGRQRSGIARRDQTLELARRFACIGANAARAFGKSSPLTIPFGTSRIITKFG